MIKVGCCGFPIAKEKYFSKFDLVEVQKTFYLPPKPDTAKKWKEKSPRSFEFTMKAWQLMTHSPKSPTYRKAGIDVEDADKYGFFKPTKEVFDAWEKTKEIADILNAKIIVFQCPPSFREEKKHVENMKDFFSSIGKNFLYAWEPRGEWSRETIREICAELQLIHCVDPFKEKHLHGKPAYFRLHGKGGYRYDYSSAELKKLLGMCEKDTYCLFNNTAMYKNAMEFKEMISSFGYGSKIFK